MLAGISKTTMKDGSYVNPKSIITITTTLSVADSTNIWQTKEEGKG